MHSGPSAGTCSALVAAALSMPVLISPALAQSQAPGGILEKADTNVTRTLWTAAQIQGFLPQRGTFTFPAPYNTTGIRITNSTDCGGTDCVWSVGYSYWRNMNNHRGSNTMLIFLGLRGSGPTLFSYDKVTGQVTKVGPLFAAGSAWASSSGEGWYFSATLPTKLYMMDGPRLLRYDVLARTFQTVFDATTQFGGGRYIWQTHSSDDDNVHSATLRDSGSYSMLGCMVYRESTQQFSFYAARGAFDECQVDRSGRWLVVKDNVDGVAGEDNRIIDLTTGTETVLLDQNGAAGHSDNGQGYMLAEDNWHSLPGAVRAWTFGQSPLQGPLVYRALSWNGGGIGHIAHANSQAGVSRSDQYACGGSATSAIAPRANELLCFKLDGSLDVLVLTQNMTNLSASGGGSDSYTKLPKANVDVTGEYLIWVSNMGGSRADAFMVRIPGYRLTGSTADTTPPAVSLTEPAAGSTVSAVATVAADATDDGDVAGVQFRLDGAPLGAEVTSPPYAVLWATTGTTNGTHTLTAVARDMAGNTATSAARTVTVSNVVAGPVISAVLASSISTTGATITWTTSVASDTQVEYGLTTAYGNITTLNSTLVTAHVQALTGLGAGTPWHYRVRSRDATGNLSVSADYTFTTLASLAPIVHLKLDDGTGTTAADASGNGNVGALINGPAWTAGRTGGGVSLDAVDDYVQVAHAAALNTYPLSVAVWFKTTTSAGVRGLVNKYTGGSYNGYQLFFNGGTLCAWYLRDASNYVYDGTGCTLPTPAYNDGQWHQAVFVVDASGGRLYVDGVQKGTRAWTGAAGPVSNAETVRVGHYPGAFGGAEYLAGAVDDVRIYGRALAAGEVQQIYAEGGPGTDVIFDDGFEGGSVTAWSASVTDAGDLGVSTAAALAGSAKGLDGVIDDATDMYVQDDSPQDESRYRARFYLDPRSIMAGGRTNFTGRVFIAFEAVPERRLVVIVLKRQSGKYSLAGLVRRDDNTQVSSGFIPLTTAPHMVEFDWRRSTGPGANDGWFQLWIDGTLVATHTNLDNDAGGIDFARLGLLTVSGRASGRLYLDEFVSRRESYIGPRP